MGPLDSARGTVVGAEIAGISGQFRAVQGRSKTGFSMLLATCTAATSHAQILLCVRMYVPVHIYVDIYVPGTGMPADASVSIA